MWYALPIVQKEKEKYKSWKKHQWHSQSQTGRSTQRKSTVLFRGPKYKLRAEENIVHDSFDQGSIRHSISMTGEILHQFMMVIPTGEARLEPSEFIPRVHLGSLQGKRSPVADAVEGDLLGAHGNVLEATHHQITLGVQGPSSIVHCQLEGLQFSHKG